MCMHHKYILWMFSISILPRSIFLLLNTIINLLIQSDIISLLIWLAKDTAPKIHAYFKTCQSNLTIKGLQSHCFDWWCGFSISVFKIITWRYVWGEITPCNKIDKPLVVYRFSRNVTWRPSQRCVHIDKNYNVFTAEMRFQSNFNVIW